MKISASIYSDKSKPIPTLVKELDAHGIDMLHIDCADNWQVFEDIKTIRSISQTAIDLHLISENPEQYFTEIEALEIENVSIQFEKLKEIPLVSHFPKTAFGIALIASTSIENLGEIATKGYKNVMLMCTEPGKSGGVFGKENFQRIVAVKNEFPDLKIQVDGGVNNEIAFVLKLLGVDSIVSGSYLMQQESLSAGMMSFFKPPKNDNFKVEDFFTPLCYLPILSKNELSFKKVLETIEQYKQGFVLIENDDKTLHGIISNADVRRAVLKNIDNLSAISTAELVNQNPITINTSTTLNEMLKTVNALPFIVLFLPVIDENNLLKGAVLLNNLTRG